MSIKPDQSAEFSKSFTRLMQWASSVNQDALSDQPRQRSALVLADDIAAMVLGSSEPEVSRTIEQFVKASFATQATILKRGLPKVDRYSAAAANGMAITWTELDEGFRQAPSHGGAYAIPAAIAEAEFRESTVSQLLTALAVSYEITARLALTFKFDVMTVHPHAALASIGAAAATALLRGVDDRTFQAAVTNACAMTFAGPFNHAIRGALVRNAWTSAGAWIGMKSVDWAEAGISGLAETPLDVFVNILGAKCAPAELTRGLDSGDWAIGHGYHKTLACCQYIHSAVEANLQLVARLQVANRRLGEIRDILVETHRLAIDMSNMHPATTLAAKFSVPHAVAASATLGEGGFEAFTTKTLQDPLIAETRSRVRLSLYPHADPWPNDRAARVTWTFWDGEEWQAVCNSAKGGADNPHPQSAIADKIAYATEPHFPNMARVLIALQVNDMDPTLSWSDVIAEMMVH